MRVHCYSSFLCSLSLTLAAMGMFLAVSGGQSALAAQYDLAVLFPNVNFESGLGGWNYTGAGVNANTYLTNSEWSAQSWSASSPFYTDAQLTSFYPGQPWGRDPNITHIDQTGVADDPTTVIAAAEGYHFVGSRQDGYEGHYRRAPGEPPQPAGGFYDTNFQLTSNPISGSFVSGDTFTLTVWGVRGRLRSDWSTPNASSTGSASKLSARLTGGTFETAIFDFASWAADGQWAPQTFVWQLQSNTTSVRVVITAQNQNHDRFVAVDAGLPCTATESTTWGAIKSLFR